MTWQGLKIRISSEDKPLEARFYSCSGTTAIAIVAHPYGPLGGSQDDPVVVETAKTLQDRGCPTYTFNFSSPTSWGAKQERRDYLKVVEHALNEHKNISQLCCCGYSYGSLCLPSQLEVERAVGRDITITYIVISPLLAPVTTILTLSTTDHYRHIKDHPNLAIWGDCDNFTSASRLQKSWPSGISVTMTNHFWRLQASMDELTNQIRNFINNAFTMPP